MSRVFVHGLDSYIFLGSPLCCVLCFLNSLVMDSRDYMDVLKLTRDRLWVNMEGVVEKGKANSARVTM